MGVALVVRPACPSGASKSIVGSSITEFGVPRDAPPTRPPGAPRDGGLYTGSDEGASFWYAVGAGFCATEGADASHATPAAAVTSPLTLTLLIIRCALYRIITSFRSAE